MDLRKVCEVINLVVADGVKKKFANLYKVKEIMVQNVMW